jgi:L1 cell adhesion molecule like protein
MDLFDECIRTVESCLSDSKIYKSDIDDVVLVGGSSRIPKVQDLLQDFFKGKDLCKSINLDEAVAYGAAVQAAILSEGFNNVPNLVLRDVTPLSLGIAVNVEDVMDVVIPRNTSVPVKKTKQYCTAYDNQFSVPINVYEGERARVKDNNLLGSFILSCLPGAPRGHPLEVSAKEISTGNMNEISITNDKERLSTFEIKKMIAEAETYHVEDKKFLRKAKVISALDSCVYNIKNALKKKDAYSMLTPQESEKINNAITVSMNLLDKNNQQKEIDVLEGHLKQLDSMFENLKAKTG